MVKKSKEVISTKARHARIIMPEKQEEQTFDAPAEVTTLGEGEEATSSLTPVVSFDEVGDYVLGVYFGSRDNIGPNKSRLYDLRIQEEQLKRIGADKIGIPVKGGMIVSVWGSTILDGMMERLNPSPGKLLYIQYTGQVETERKQNPAKTFKVIAYPAPS